MDNKIFIASDHAGFDLKQKLIEEMPNDTFEDLGTNSKESVDYTGYANKLVDKFFFKSPAPSAIPNICFGFL